VTLIDVTIDSNESSGDGGGIDNVGFITADGVTLSRNQAAGVGGALYNHCCGFEFDGGEITGVLELTNVTIAENTAGDGGGIFNDRFPGMPPTVMLTNVTVDRNSSTGASGGNVTSRGSTARVGAKNSIVARGRPQNCDTPIRSFGHNLEDADTCRFHASGDLVNTDPLLGPLADNGGLTLTEALRRRSPAIDAGRNAGCPPTDQRDVSRPQDGDGDGLAVCDMGAYERQASA
jgi:hypothetical protein